MRRPPITATHLVVLAIALGAAGLAIWIASVGPRPVGTLPLSLAALAALVALLAALIARRQSTDRSQAVQALIAAADRIGRGDLTSALPPGEAAPLAGLQERFEEMRVALRQTTYSRDYLHSVLNSMSEAVFVAAPDGQIRIVNDAAAKLMACDPQALIGRRAASLLQPGEGGEQETLRLACNTNEAVLRTSSGQTIPVSFMASTIATADPQFAGDIYVVRDITERKRAERRIRYLARYDALTKIPNRMQFQHLLQQAIARSRRGQHGVALLYIDMDRFKEINDTFGHASGDRVIEVLAERLSAVLPPDAVLGRLAGDEFALFLDGITVQANEARALAANMARTVLDKVGSAFHVNQQELFLTVSIGIAFCPRDADNVIDLIRNADAAMYHSKQNGGNSHVFYSQEMNAAAVERLLLKSKLRRAVERDEFVVHYQPKVSLRDGRIVGAEALLRWRLPGHGDIPPSQFIPLAEENNLISSIGEWVLEHVCIDVQQLRESVADPGRVALNLSLQQLRQASFMLNCRSIFNRHDVPVETLELEITESTLMADPQRTIKLLQQLSGMGLHLAIDDFGTGYSSLSVLQQFPIGTLKIDQSFVRAVESENSAATLVRTIIDMGHGLGLTVVAEGVETAGQLRFLADNGCDQAQGNLFGEPASVGQLRAQLGAQESRGPVFAALLPARLGSRLA